MITTHFPDLAVASAPAAGFIAIEYYVPYTLRVGYAHMDKYLTAVCSIPSITFPFKESY
jgi:hypothetical protein